MAAAKLKSKNEVEEEEDVAVAVMFKSCVCCKRKCCSISCIVICKVNSKKCSLTVNVVVRFARGAACCFFEVNNTKSPTPSPTISASISGRVPRAACRLRIACVGREQHNFGLVEQIAPVCLK